MSFKELVTEISIFNFDFALLFAKLVLCAAAVFFATIAWERNRTAGFSFIFCGITSFFAGTIFEILVRLQIFDGKEFVISGVSVLPLFFDIAPVLFFLIGFLAEALKK